MANFNPPFSTSADHRFPTSDERQLGFPCGAADQELFNGMFYRIEAELGEVINYAGIEQTDDRMTLLREAIVALIDAATGGGDPSIYLLMAQARARLPIYPEVLNTDGRIVVTSPAPGTVRLPGGVTFQHRGIYPVTTGQEDFATTASKIYHLRWTPADGYLLRDLADPIYNPTAVAETSTIFDSGHDDMLIARIVTNSSNVATITNLSNKDRLIANGESGNLLPTIFEDNKAPNQLTGPEGQIVNLNWARKPNAYMTGFTDVTVQSGTSGTTMEANVVVQSLSRYQVKLIYQRTATPGGGFLAYSAFA